MHLFIKRRNHTKNIKKGQIYVDKVSSVLVNWKPYDDMREKEHASMRATERGRARERDRERDSVLCSII